METQYLLFRLRAIIELIWSLMKRQTLLSIRTISKSLLNDTILPHENSFAMNPTILSFIAVICGLLGSAVLAFSVGRIIKILIAAANAHELTLECMNDPERDIPVFIGFDKQLDRAVKYDAKILVGGLLLLVASFALEFVAQLMPVANGG